MGQIYGSAVLTIALNTSQDLSTQCSAREMPSDWESIAHDCKTSTNFAWRMRFGNVLSKEGQLVNGRGAFKRDIFRLGCYTFWTTE